MGSRNLVDAAPTLRRGGSDSTVTRTCRATGEALLVPMRNHRSKVDRITGSTGKSIEGERVTDGFAVALKRGNARGAKEPWCLRSLRPQGRQGRDDKGVHRFAGPEVENIRQGEGRDVLEVSEPSGLRLEAVEYAMDVQRIAPIQGLLGCTTRAESRSGRIGPINLEAKQTGERSAGNPHAAFDAAEAGNVARSRWCDTRGRKGEPTGNTNFDLTRRASLRPYR